MLAKIKQFIAPPQFPDDDEKTRIANLLNTLLWMFIAVFTTLTVVSYPFAVDSQAVLSYVIVAVANVLPLSLLRRGNVKVASWLTIGIFYIGTVWAGFYFSGLNVSIVSSLMMLVLLTGLLIGRTEAIVLTVLTIAVSGILIQQEAAGQIVPIYTSPLTNILSFGANLTLLAITLTLTLRDLNNTSRRMQQSNKELKAIQVNLEKVVADRTRALELAAEVGRNISQVREMERLLQDAVNLIQKQFSLYYVQVYLADKKQTHLSLKAGAGLIGKQLVQRDHGLPFGVGSINGLAAAEKRTIVVADTAVSPLFKANSLLPKTRSEMAIPLLVSEKVVGVLNLQSDVINGLSDENRTAFEALAGQIAITVENANLFAEAAQARADVERTLGFMTRQGWDNFQDGLNQPETIGFAYEEDAIHPIVDTTLPLSNNGTYLQVPITVADELVGHIVLEGNDTRSWSAEERELVTTIAQQVGQQSENLRLLAETNRYRQEAEQAARHMRHEAWRDYLSDQLKTSGFAYDQRQVTAIDEAEDEQLDLANNEMLRQPLTIKGEPFGEIMLDAAINPETKALVATVARQLSDHLDNLRLSNQTEKALAETAEQARRLAALNEIGHDLSAATDMTEIFTVLSQHMPSLIPHDALSFAMADPNGTNAKIVAAINGQMVTIFEDHPITGTMIELATKQRQLVYLADTSEHDYVDTNVMVERLGVRSVMIAPLLTARGFFGGIDLMSKKVDGFDDQDKTLLQQIASLVASTVESQQLFAEAQQQAQKERLVNIVSQKIQSTVTIESALETAVRELGNALQANYTQVELATLKSTSRNKGVSR